MIRKILILMTMTVAMLFSCTEVTEDNESKEITANNVVQKISELSDGTHTIKLTGDIDSSTLANIKKVMNKNLNINIVLDLSQTTGLTSVEQDVFLLCPGLISVILPDSVTSIEKYAFQFSRNLASITIPDSVTSIDGSAFACCAGLTEFNISTDNENFSTSNDGKMLLSKDKKTLIAYPSASGDFTIPEYIDSIGESAFLNNEKLTSVIIPDNVTEIGERAFMWCDLTNVTIGSGMQVIKGDPFFNCINLIKVIISDGVTAIDGSVFNLCENLTSIVFPDSLTFISRNAFGECDKLTTVNYKGTQEQWEQINIEDYDNSCLKNAIINYEYSGK